MVTYEGIFFEGESAKKIYSLEGVHLDLPIDKLHCTFKYRPSDEQIFDDIVGQEVEIAIIGYGCDGNNSGFEIVIPEDVMSYYLNCDKNDPSKITIPHITVSLAKGAKAVNTKNLEFKPLDNPCFIRGRFGYCIRSNGKEYISYTTYFDEEKKQTVRK